jgi:RimJ/RimL family protein N-acetyltransferase
MKVPQIETERLLMRTYTIEDLKAVYVLITDPDVTRYFPEDYSVKKEDVLASLPRRMEKWRKHGFGQLGVYEKASGKLIGYCGLQYLDKTSEVEIYYGFSKDVWRRGIATEAAQAMLRFGFEEVKLEKMVAVTHPENIASQKVLERLGFRRGERRRFYNVEADYFSISKQDYNSSFEEAKFVLTYSEIDV